MYKKFLAINKKRTNHPVETRKKMNREFTEKETHKALKPKKKYSI